MLICKKFPSPKIERLHIKSILGGFLIQTQDNAYLKTNDFKVVTKRKPTKKEIEDLQSRSCLRPFGGLFSAVSTPIFASK